MIRITFSKNSLVDAHSRATIDKRGVLSHWHSKRKPTSSRHYRAIFWVPDKIFGKRIRVTFNFIYIKYAKTLEWKTDKKAENLHGINGDKMTPKRRFIAVFFFLLKSFFVSSLLIIFVCSPFYPFVGYGSF